MHLRMARLYFIGLDVGSTGYLVWLSFNFLTHFGIERI
jgi:hypothetical protein